MKKVTFLFTKDSDFEEFSKEIQQMPAEIGSAVVSDNEIVVTILDANYEVSDNLPDN